MTRTIGRTGGLSGPARALATALAVASFMVAAAAAALPAASRSSGPSAAVPASAPDRAAATGAEVYDAQAYWHFLRIDGIWRTPEGVLVCVQKADGHRDFWDPRRDVLLGTRHIDCLPPAGSRPLDPSVGREPLAGSLGLVPTDASFAGGAPVYYHHADFSHCEIAFERIYTVRAPGAAPYDFYALRQARHPRPVDLSGQACGLTPGVVTTRYTPRWETVEDLQSLDLGEHRTLLLARIEDHEPVALVLHDRPRNPWMGAQGVALVPAARLQPALEQAGPDFVARQKVVEQLMAGSR